MGLPIPGYSEIVELLKKGLTLEAQEKVMQLREAVLEPKEENHQLREKLRQAEERLSVKENLVFNGRSYELKKENGRPQKFCPLCYDRAGKLMNLLTARSPDLGFEVFCGGCDLQR